MLPRSRASETTKEDRSAVKPSSIRSAEPTFLLRVDINTVFVIEPCLDGARKARRR